MRCAIWYHLYNLNNVKKAHGEVCLSILEHYTLKGQILFFYLVGKKSWRHLGKSG